MRLVAGLIVAVSLATPVAAQEGMALLKAYRAASTLFLGGESNNETYTYGLTAKLFDGLEGKWFDISAVMPDPFVDGAVIGPEELSMFTRTCNVVGTTIAVTDAYTAQFSIPVKDSEPVVTTYSSRGGSVFGAFTPIPDVLRRLGLDQPDSPQHSIMPVLANVNGIATMHRPAPDLLVVQTNYAMPRIYARCP